MKRRIFPVMAVLALIVCALVVWLRPAAGHATPQAVAELDALRHTDIPALKAAGTAPQELLEVMDQVLEHFADTMDVHYTAPQSGIGILHLACLFKKTELVRCLLLDGADPNRRAEEDDSPLLLALSTDLTPQATAQDIIRTVETLLAGGADFRQGGYEPGDFLTWAAYECENEQVILYLTEQKGVHPDANTATPLALHGWDKALAAVLRTGPQSTQGLLHCVAKGCTLYEGRYAECLRLLLEKGADINAPVAPEMPDTTPLFILAEGLCEQPADSPYRAQALDMLQLLLRHGADPTLRADNDEEHPGFTPYDLLAQHPGLLTELAERGIVLPEPEMRISSGIPLLADVCRVAANPPAAEHLLPHCDAIAAVLTPSPEMQQEDIYPQALESAVALLARISPARAAELLLNSPLWQQSAAAKQGQAISSALVRAVRAQAAIPLPPPFICSTAEQWADAGLADEAAALLELLARHPDTQETILRYCRDAQPALQAGAYAALLSLRHLPDARDGGVEEWLRTHGRAADTEVLQQALLLTSLERLWYGQMPTEEQQQLLGLMRRIGAPAAAAAYEQITRHLDDPAALDALMQRGDSWKFELETATARFILEHAASFAAPSP